MDSKILAQFRAALPAAAVITRPEELYTYECDGLTNFRVRPDAVFLPSSTTEVQSILRVCHEHRIPFVARGSGTGLSGGSLPVEGGVVIGMNRMNRILEVDLENGIMVVEPGVINLNVTAAAAARNYFYAPDPSSQQICSIGGNVAENAGGAHCLKYGFTTTHVRGLEVVLPDGSLVHLGGKAPDAPGYDLCGVFVGSEGTLAAVFQVAFQSFLHEAIDLMERLAGIAATEVVAPASQVVVDLCDQRRDWHEALLRTGHFPQLVPFPLQ